MKDKILNVLKHVFWMKKVIVGINVQSYKNTSKFVCQQISYAKVVVFFSNIVASQGNIFGVADKPRRHPSSMLGSCLTIETTKVQMFVSSSC